MDKYNKNLNMIINQFRENDEKDRKSRGLSKTRSDIEAIEYRNNFDTFYTSITNELINSYKSDFGKLMDHPSASIFINDIDMTRYHDFLDDHLVLPHAIAKLLDYQTNSMKNNFDIGKICNLFALARIGMNKKLPIDESKERFLRAYQSLVNGFIKLNVVEGLYGNIGIITGTFLYWLIYDCSSNELNLNILVDLAEATKGSFYDFKCFIAGYWEMRRINPVTSVKFFYSDMLPNIK